MFLELQWKRWAQGENEDGDRGARLSSSREENAIRAKVTTAMRASDGNAAKKIRSNVDRC